MPVPLRCVDELLPIMHQSSPDVRANMNRSRRQRLRIEDPRAGNQFLQNPKGPSRKRFAPIILEQVMVKESHRKFLFEDRSEGRSYLDFLILYRLHQIVGRRETFKFVKLEKRSEERRVGKEGGSR